MKKNIEEPPLYPKVQGRIRIQLDSTSAERYLTLAEARLLVNRVLGQLNRAGQRK